MVRHKDMKDVKTLKVVHNFTHVTKRPQGGPKKVSHYHESSLKPAI